MPAPVLCPPARKSTCGPEVEIGYCRQVRISRTAETPTSGSWGGSRRGERMRRRWSIGATRLAAVRSDMGAERIRGGEREREVRQPPSIDVAYQPLQNPRVKGSSIANNSRRPMTIMASEDAFGEWPECVVHRCPTDPKPGPMLLKVATTEAAVMRSVPVAATKREPVAQIIMYKAKYWSTATRTTSEIT